MLDADDALTETAGKAFRLTRFYAEVYEAEPAHAAEVPYISDSDYQRAVGLLDCVVDREAIIGILPPYYRDASRFPFTVPEDEAELVLRQRRIVRAMKHLGVDFGASPRFLIVADRRHLCHALEQPRHTIWLVDHCGDPPVDGPEYPSLLYADGVDLIGSRLAGSTGYDYDPEQLRLEVDPASLISHVSKLQFTCFPLVRYGLGRRVPTAEAPEMDAS
jgi:hypothetical protein